MTLEPSVLAVAAVVLLLLGIMIGRATKSTPKQTLVSVQDLERLYLKRLEVIIQNPEETPDSRIILANKLQAAYKDFSMFFFGTKT